MGAFDKKWDKESQQDPIQRITKGIWSYQSNSNTTGLILFQQEGNIVYVDSNHRIIKCSDCNCTLQECNISPSPRQCPNCSLEECCCCNTINENWELITVSPNAVGSKTLVYVILFQDRVRILVLAYFHVENFCGNTNSSTGNGWTHTIPDTTPFNVTISTSTLMLIATYH